MNENRDNYGFWYDPDRETFKDIYCKCNEVKPNNFFMLMLNEENDKMRVICSECGIEQNLNMEKIKIEVRE